MRPALVGKVAKDLNAIEYSPVCQDLFDGNRSAKVLKTKDSKETIRASLAVIQRRNRLKKNWLDTVTEAAGECTLLCKVDLMEVFTEPRVILRVPLLELQTDL